MGLEDRLCQLKGGYIHFPTYEEKIGGAAKNKLAVSLLYWFLWDHDTVYECAALNSRRFSTIIAVAATL